MNKIDITKKIVSFIVGAGTTKIVTGIIQNNVSPNNIYDKVTIVGAGVVIGSMAADATKEYTGAKIDEMTEWWRVNVTKRAT